MIPLPDEVAQVKPNNAAITNTLFQPWKKTSKTITNLDLASVGTCPILKPQSFLKGFRLGNPIFLTGHPFWDPYPYKNVVSLGLQVLLSHGDELLLQDPANGDQESKTRY